MLILLGKTRYEDVCSIAVFSLWFLTVQLQNHCQLPMPFSFFVCASQNKEYAI